MKHATIELAKTLRELGYDGEYSKMYNTSNQLIEKDEIAKPYRILAPRLDDAAYWLRERHGICISVTPNHFGDNAKSFPYRIDQWNEEIAAIDAWFADIYSVELLYNDAYGLAAAKATETIKERQH